MSVQNSPYAGVGITLGYKISPAVTFTSLVWLKDDCEFSGFENEVIKIKPIASASVTKVGGRTDSGTFTGSSYLVNADSTVAEMLSLAASKMIVPWQLQLPDGSSSTSGTTYAFSGIVSSVKLGNFTGEDAPSIDFEIAISGFVTITPAT